MSGDVWGEIVEQTRILTRSTRHLAHRHFEIYEGLSPALGSTLAIVAKKGPMRLTELAAYLQVDASVASRQTADLVHRGLVLRQPDPADARAGLLEVSADGEAIVERVRDRQVEVLRTALDEWSDADARALLTLMTRLNADFQHGLAMDDALTTYEPHRTHERIQ